MKKQFYMGILLTLIAITVLASATYIVKNVELTDDAGNYVRDMATSTGKTESEVTGTLISRQIASQEAIANKAITDAEKLEAKQLFNSIIDNPAKVSILLPTLRQVEQQRITNSTG